MNESTNPRARVTIGYGMSVWALLAALYLVLRFGFTQKLDELGPYSSIVFEIFDVVVAALISGRAFLKYFTVTRSTLIASATALSQAF